MSRRILAASILVSGLLTGCPPTIISPPGSTGGGDTGGRGGMGGAAGAGGTMIECSIADDCPGVVTACKRPSCDNGVCGFYLEPAGNGTKDQTDGDCQSRVCDGNGAVLVINATHDKPNDNHPCTDDLCDSSTPSQPSHPPLAVGAACSENNGTMCDGAGKCVECISGSDCASEVCQQNGCVPATCADTTKNGNETDIDCGGADCGDCTDGKACGIADDCISKVCATNVCTSPTCDDLAKNGAETDIDCGGGTCIPCGPTQGCLVDADCVGGSCSGASCLPTCSDMVKNADETDVDCGGPTCAPCGPTFTCSIPADCDSGICTNNKCAASTCNDAVKNGSETGIDCGGGTCSACLANSPCDIPADCDSGVCTGNICQAPTCDDMVKNGSETDTDCGGGCPNGCAAGAPCTVHADCAFNACVGGVCQATGCGNGIVNAPEACDDGNLIGGDCCSADCQLEPDCEIEPNGSLGLSNVMPVGGIMKAHIIPVGDEDYFRFNVAQATDVKIETFEGYSGASCPTAKTTVGLVHPVNGTIAVDINDGPGECSRIDSIVDGGARGLVPGTDYYIHVSRPDGAELPVYHVVLTFTAQCGDGMKQGSEQCDDGNTTNGDGCSSLCKIETLPEMGPNDCPTANGPPYIIPSYGLLLGGDIAPTGDKDCFRFTLPATADVVWETFDSTGPGTCGAIDTELQLYSNDCMTALGAAKNTGGISACAKLDPTTDTQVRHMAAGTYKICVNEFGNDATITQYKLFGTITALCGNNLEEGFETCDAGPGGSATCSPTCSRTQVCGDGFRDFPETCDDGNTADNDGCKGDCSAPEQGYACGSFGGPCIAICGDGIQTPSESCDDGNVANGDVAMCDSSCTPELGPTTETEPNNTFAQANANPAITGMSTTISAAITPTADKDIFKFALVSPSVVRFETFDSLGITCAGGMTTTLRVYNSSLTQIGTDNTSGIASCSAYVAYLNAGTHYVQVEETGNNATISAYKLQVKVHPVPAFAESEMNDNQLHADPAAGGDFFITGSHQINSDSDFYAIIVPSVGRSIRAEVIEGNTGETCEANGIDSRLTLFDSTGIQLADDDDDGRGSCSLIDGTGTGVAALDSLARGLNAGTYYLQVRASAAVTAQSGPSGQFDYRLAVTIR